MTSLPPDIVRTIRQSCQVLLAHEEQFQHEFHQSLVELMPETAVLREQDGVQISHSLVSCALWAVAAEESPDVISATLQRTGLDAHRRGFPRTGYQSVGHALLRSVRAVYPGDWSGTLSSSWIGYHSWLCEHWLHGADTGLFEDRTRVGVEPAKDPFRLPGGERADPASDAELDDEDEDQDDGLSYGEIMVSMTLGSARPPRRREHRRPVEEDDEEL